MVFSSKIVFLFWPLHKFTNIVERITDKMQNIFKKQEPELAYDKDLHKLQKNATYTTRWLGQITKLLFRKSKYFEISSTKLNIHENLEFVIHSFSSH